MRRQGWLVLAPIALLVGCGDDAGDRRAKAAAEPERPVPLVTVGRPVSGPRVRYPRAGLVELRARNPRGSSAFLVEFIPESRADPRDICLGVLFEALPPSQGNEYCAVVEPRGPTTFRAITAIPDRFGPAPTVVLGYAPSPVVRVDIDGPGGRHELPLSRHGAFLALYHRSVRGTATLTARLKGGATAKATLELPHPDPLRPYHPRRRAGAVFNDEIGEDVVGIPYRTLVKRFGPPARGRPQCVQYEYVGDSRSVELCLDARERVESIGPPAATD